MKTLTAPLYLRLTPRKQSLKLTFTAGGILALLISSAVSAQSLNEAIYEQLEFGAELACTELTAGYSDPDNIRFTGGLADICGTAFPSGGVGGSSAEGGSATPSISTPNIMKKVTSTADSDHENNPNYVGLTKNWGLFFTAEAETLDRDATELEGGYDSNRHRFIFGSTYRFSTKSAVSLAIDLNEHEGDYDNGDGEFDTSSQGLRLLGSFRPTNNTFINILAGYDDISTERTRTSSLSYLEVGIPIASYSGAPTADYDYNQYAISIDGGYDFQTGKYTFTPTVGLSWSNIDYGTYSEAGNSGFELTYYDVEDESLQSTIGLITTTSFGTSFGAINPQLGIVWHHEFEDDQDRTEVSFTGDTFNKRFSYETDAPDSDFFNLSVGAVLLFKNGLQGFVNVQTLLGHEYYDNTIASLGLRYEL